MHYIATPLTWIIKGLLKIIDHQWCEVEENKNTKIYPFNVSTLLTFEDFFHQSQISYWVWALWILQSKSESRRGTGNLCERELKGVSFTAAIEKDLKQKIR